MDSDERNERCDGERVGRSLYRDKRYIVDCLLNKRIVWMNQCVHLHSMLFTCSVSERFTGVSTPCFLPIATM